MSPPRSQPPPSRKTGGGGCAGDLVRDGVGLRYAARPPPTDARTGIFRGVRFCVGTPTYKNRRVFWGRPPSRAGAGVGSDPPWPGYSPRSTAAWAPDQARQRTHDAAGGPGPSRPQGFGSRSKHSRGSPREATRRAVRGQHEQLARPSRPARLDQPAVPQVRAGCRRTFGRRGLESESAPGECGRRFSIVSRHAAEESFTTLRRVVRGGSQPRAGFATISSRDRILRAPRGGNRPTTGPTRLRTGLIASLDGREVD